MPEPAVINRPPLIDLAFVSPTAPTVKVNVNPECPSAPDFSVGVLDLDLEQTLKVRWFLDYDLRGDDPKTAPIADYNLEPTGQVAREDAAFLGDELLARLPSLGLHVLEVFVVEEEAVGDSGQPPRWRALIDCEARGNPPGCLHTHPALFRWAVEVEDTVCPT